MRSCGPSNTMRRGVAILVVLFVALVAAEGCALPRCSAGSTCTCSGAGDCSRYCDGSGCNFQCESAGDCYFECLGGGCSVTAGGAGNIYLSCEVGNCTMNCTGDLTCER
jgi:hypothetical protein